MRIDEFGATDTTEKVRQRMYELLRAMTPQQRAKIMLERIESMRALSKHTRELRKPYGTERI